VKRDLCSGRMTGGLARPTGVPKRAARLGWSIGRARERRKTKDIMNDNYLWDRTGEIDPEIQQLEETLGALRYQPRPLQIPAHFKIGQRRRFQPLLAIAAAIALVAVALGLWLAIKQRQTAPSPQANQESPREERLEKPQ